MALLCPSIVFKTRNKYIDIPYIAYTVNFRYLEVVGTIFYKFKSPEVQINLHFE